MDRHEFCMVEFYWAPPVGVDAVRFKPAFSVFHPDGRRETQEGANKELVAFLNQLGAQGWHVVNGVSASNWILYTLERKLG